MDAQIARIGVHGCGQQCCSFFVHEGKVSLIKIVCSDPLVVGHQQDVFLPVIGIIKFGVGRALIGDDFYHHVSSLVSIGCGQPSDVHIGNSIFTADGYKPLIGDRLTLVLGKNQIGGQIVGGITHVPVALGIIAAITHQQHILRRRWCPVVIGIG